MLGIINRIIKDFSHLITGVEKWALKLIHAVYSFVNKLFAELRKSVNSVYQSLVHFARSITKYASQVYTFARWIVEKYVPSVIRWADQELHALLNDINSVLHYAETWIVRLANDIVSAVRNVTSWVIDHVYRPLLNDVTTVWHWITHEGAFIYDLITHPEKLAALLASYLWGSWLGLFKSHGKQIARWLLKGMPNMVGELTDALETFISNLL